MSPQIQFINGANSITVDTPEYGYDVSISMKIAIQKAADNTVPLPWDNGVAYDVRKLSCEFLLPVDQQEDSQDFFSDAAKGRCESVTLALGATPTGFYPGGPDKGDVGNFTAQLISQEQGPAIPNMKTWFRNKCEFIISGFPGTGLPTQVSQGNFQIGTVSGLQYPQAGFELTAIKNFLSVQALTGYFVDGATSGDAFENSFTVDGNVSKIAALVAFLTGASGRATDIDIIAPAGFYPYGIESGASGTFVSKLLQPELVVTHNRYDGFSIPLSFWMKSVS